MGAISRVLKKAVMKPEYEATPSWSRAAYPCSPTSVPVKKHRNAMTPTVPPMIASDPLPKTTSDSSRIVSFL